MADAVPGPIAERPYMPGYGVPDDAEGLLPWSWAGERLAASRNYWVVTASADGRPHAMPVWGVWDDEDDEAASFWFSCGPASRKHRNVAANPYVVVTTSDTVEVVSVQGVAEIVADADRRRTMIARYVDKYAEPGDGPLAAAELAAFVGEQAIVAVHPERAFGIIEHADEFAARATRWRWPTPGGRAR
jgi:PPOX class probable F420-dependent enzyme